MNGPQTDDADVCFIFEGSYPFVSGGVSHWAQDLIQSQSHLKFHIVSIEPPDSKLLPVYTFPKNVVGSTVIRLQALPPGVQHAEQEKLDKLFSAIELPLLKLQHFGSPNDFKALVEAVDNFGAPLGSKILIDSEDAWKMTLRMYRSTMGYSGFLNFYFSWKGLISSFFSILLSKIPKAKVYHASSTGYSGLFLTFAKLHTGRPCIVTEHGIYTNERRIEITLAEWLHDEKSMDLVVDAIKEEMILDRVLKDYWIDTFYGYSKLCYQASDKIITLFDGNQEFQLADGAEKKKMAVIPNGVNIQKFSSVVKKQEEIPIVALIGRVVPIKDIKSFIHSIDLLRKKDVKFKALVIGPTEEDPEYFEECKKLVGQLKLEDTLFFTGKVNTLDYLPKIHLIVLTSISESQPLVILEAGAAGIPCVATDAGCCGELIYGKADESPRLGPGGALSPLYNPASIADNIHRLLTESEYYKSCSEAIKKRIATYYDANDVIKSYRELYDQYIGRN
ncbi:MAG: GT4 family glycosyltransferase PelF [Parachlamydiaceae bacterium]